MTRTHPRIFSFLVVLLWLTAPGLASAQWGDDELLEPDKAFAFDARVTGPERVRVEWQVADGYYMYRSRIQLKSDTPGITLGAPVFPDGKVTDDEFFGRVEIYRGAVPIDIPVLRAAGAPAELKLVAISQGCADLGICYPPHTQTAQLDLAAAAPVAAAATATKTDKAAADPLEKLSAFGRDLGRDLGFGFGDGNDFLDPEIAFQPSVIASPDGTALIVRWDIAKDYYLYRDKLRITLEDGAGIALQPAQFPAGEIKDDETFGRVEVYHDGVEARVPLTRTSTAPTAARVTLGYQGCAEAGICYPPQTKDLVVDLPAALGIGTAAAAPPTTAAPVAAAMTTAADTSAPLAEQDRIAARLASGNVLLTMLTFFGFGLLLSFTPCVFPMIPILSSIIIGQGEKITTGRAFTLSLIYVLAMALTYTGAGVAAGLSGENLQAAFQNPWILGSFAAVFVLLSLSMFGFYELQMPASLQSKLSQVSGRQKSGSLTGVAIMGFLSALIVGPCVAAPLAGALIYISQSGDPYLGGAALFALSMGMGVPLLIIGTGAGKYLPKAGGWMNIVKAVFGVMLLAVAIWMLERILPVSISMALWAGLLIISAVYMGALDALDVDATGWHKLWKGLGLILLVYGGLQLVGVATGGRDVLQPLRGAAFSGNATMATARTQVEFRKIKSVEDLEREVRQASAQGKGVMLDFFAEWCTDCHRMIKNTFSNSGVQAALGNVVTLKADVTANDDVDKALLKHFGLYGPPAILFFGTDGQELARQRVVGYMDAEKFTAHVQRAFGGV